MEELTANDYLILKKMGDCNERKTIFKLAELTGLASTDVEARLANLIKLGFVKQWRKSEGRVNYSRTSS